MYSCPSKMYSPRRTLLSPQALRQSWSRWSGVSTLPLTLHNLQRMYGSSVSCANSFIRLSLRPKEGDNVCILKHYTRFLLDSFAQREERSDFVLNCHSFFCKFRRISFIYEIHQDFKTDWSCVFYKIMHKEPTDLKSCQFKSADRCTGPPAGIVAHFGSGIVDPVATCGAVVIWLNSDAKVVEGGAISPDEVSIAGGVNTMEDCFGFLLQAWPGSSKQSWRYLITWIAEL